MTDFTLAKAKTKPGSRVRWSYEPITNGTARLVFAHDSGSEDRHVPASSYAFRKRSTPRSPSYSIDRHYIILFGSLAILKTGKHFVTADINACLTNALYVARQPMSGGDTTDHGFEAVPNCSFSNSWNFVP